MEENKELDTIQMKRWLEGMSNGTFGSEIHTISLQGLQVVTAQKGWILCTFLVPKTLADADGNWHAGAISTIMDDLAAAAVASENGKTNVSVDFDVTYLSTVKTEEEVELEGKVLSHKGKLTCVLVEVRRKHSKEVVVFGKQWMSSINMKSKL